MHTFLNGITSGKNGESYELVLPVYLPAKATYAGVVKFFLNVSACLLYNFRIYYGCRYHFANPLDRRWINHATNGNHLTTSRVFLVLYGIRSPKESVQIKAIRNGAKNTVMKKEATSGSVVEHSETAEFPVLPERQRFY